MRKIFSMGRRTSIDLASAPKLFHCVTRNIPRFRPSVCIFIVAVVIAATGPDRPEAAAQDRMFPFLVSYDAPDNATNVSKWLEKPAGQGGFVRVTDGRFATDAGPIRFWATNLCFDACFPSHKQAERVAARLARFGINCVRMHHMDSRSIWGDSRNKLTIDPVRLERLDYLVFQLKQHGIYTDINLHVSRTLGAAEGFPIQGGRPNYDKGIDNFEPRMIELQKKYARDLLTHVNPHTGNAYRDEPAVAMVEINNENALFNQWSRNELDHLTDPYATTFRQQWNTWLRNKYRTTSRLRQTWEVGQVPLGANLIVNGDFTQPLVRHWHLEQDSQTEVAWRIGSEGPSGSRCLQIDVTRPGNVSWHPQLSQAGFELKKDSPYTLTCFLRASTSRNISLNCMMAHEPWERLGFSTTVNIGQEWERYEFTFVAERDDPNARITLSGLTAGTYELANVTFRSGGIVGLDPISTLEDDSVPVMKHGQANWTKTARRDFIDFLWDTEQAYWVGFYQFLKDEVGVRSTISGTQLGYSPIGIQSRLDYIDAHAYWQHPRFPGRAWDSKNWHVLNRALVNEPSSTLTSLAARRIGGLPFTVSEYNHPTPVAYEAEGFLMLSAFAAFQAWDGIFSFAYCHNADFEPKAVKSYFDLKANAVKLVHMPACAAMFLRGDVQQARQVVTTPMTVAEERSSLHRSGDPWRFTRERFGTDPRLALLHKVELNVVKTTDRSVDTKKADALNGSKNGPKEFISDTKQLKWNVKEPEAGYFIANTPNTKMFTGFVHGRTFSLGDIQLKVGESLQDWATISLVCLDGQGMTGPGRILIAATGQMLNTGARLEDLGQDRITLQAGWGNEPLLCEGILAQISLPVATKRVQLFALDASGNRGQSIHVGDKEGKAVLNLSPEYQTLWYEVVVR